MATKQFVSVKNESPKMFENKFLDFFSRVHPAVVPIVFIPFIGFFVYLSLVTHQTGLGLFFGMTIVGLFFWTLFEYLLHRYFFHLEFKSKIGQRIHFMAHGVHHDYPNDMMRLVMPPAVSLLLAFIIYWPLLWIIGNAGMTDAFFSGFVFGYLVYDMTHFATHYYNFKNAWFQSIKRSHMDHHYVDHDNGFGLSTVFWDKVFGTTHKQEKKEQ